MIRVAHGYAVAYDTGWLRVSLLSAARKAGYQCWLLVDDLVAGVSLYLRDCYLGSVIDRHELEKAICCALRDTGYEEVARFFRAATPFQSISLIRCLREAATSNRDSFFNHLGEAIVALNEAKVRRFHFSDLRACVDELHPKGDATAGSSRRLRAKIVVFVRERLRALPGRPEIWCSIS